MIKIKKSLFSISLLLVIVASINTSCNTIEYVNRYYQITKCADPWHVEDASAEEYGNNAISYLLSAGIDVKEPILSSDSEDFDDETCITCECKTTDRLRVDVHRDDASELETNFGFTKD